MKSKRVFIIMTVIVLIIVVLSVGKSLSFFQYTKKGETVNIVTINGLDVEVLNKEADALNLNNAYPMTDAEGLRGIPFKFRVINTSNRKLTYSIKVVSDEEKMVSCTLEDRTACKELSTNFIKFTYQKNEDGYTIPGILGSYDNTVSVVTIGPRETIVHSIILWIKSDAGNEIMNHQFYGKVILEGSITS